ncbi:hypothetical protein KIN20_031953 [Parelaphostrongylus tenuis]|uniref:Uncharacterized protein n=1 Tax=Parelaphostrongylus tenuis TaxID=148309 RepID=A0AAD5R672_PARTN|nr:hypothetical protein KIN20_031953 [Parelaphostrongylus tenuis]
MTQQNRSFQPTQSPLGLPCTPKGRHKEKLEKQGKFIDEYEESIKILDFVWRIALFIAFVLCSISLLLQHKCFMRNYIVKFERGLEKALETNGMSLVIPIVYQSSALNLYDAHQILNLDGVDKMVPDLSKG